MNEDEDGWFDEEAGPLVRPYTVTGGRTRTATFGLELITLVVALPLDPWQVGLDAEYAEIVRMCQQPLSVAEVSARLDLPLAVVKVLLGDLIEEKYLIFRSAAPRDEVPDMRLLRTVLDGIRDL
jgi:hypothetical protein